MGWPKYLRKTYEKENLKKMIMKQVQMPGDRKFLASLFTKDDRGKWSLKKDISKEDKRRLKKLVKEIKKGKGGVKIIPLLILLVILAGTVLFSLIFKNPLLEGYLESSLGSFFGATVDVEELDVSLLRTRVSFASLEIADESDLNRNLIELGYTEATLESRALLQKKVVIKSLQCRRLDWFTERDVPAERIVKEGKMAVDEAREGGTPGGGGEGKLLSFLEEHGDPSVARLSQAVQDPKAFADEQWNSLKTPAAIEETRIKYDTLIKGYPAKIDGLTSLSQSMLSDGETFLSKDYNTYLTNPQKIPELIEEADAYREKVTGAAETIRDEIDALDRIRRDLDADKERLLRLKDEDLAAVSTMVALPDGGVETILKGMVQSYVASLLGDRYAKVMKIAGYVRKYRENREEPEPDDAGKGRQGRTIPFETLLWPDILLEEALGASSGAGITWEAALRDLAGEPDQWTEPTTLDLTLSSGDGILTGQGLIDGRSEPASSSGGDVDFKGFPITTDALSGLGISRTSGMAGGTSTLTVDGGRWRSRTDLVISRIEMARRSQDRITELVYRVLAGEDWDMTIIMEGRGREVSFQLDWPLMAKVDDEIGTMLKEQADLFLAGVEEELRRRYARELDVLEQYVGDIDQYKGILEGDFSSLENQKDAVKDQIEGVRNRAEDLVNQKLDEAKRLAEEELAKAQKLAEEEAQRMKAEAEAEAARLQAEADAKIQAAEEEAARLKAEAEAKAEEERKKAEAAAAEEAEKLLEESGAAETLNNLGSSFGF